MACFIKVAALIGREPAAPRGQGAWVMTVWFNDLTMQDTVHKRRQRELVIHEETRAEVLRRAAHLDGRDETLLRLALEGNVSYRTLNRIVGGRSAGTTHRRVRALLRRLTEPVVAALVDRPGELSAMQREVGIRRFVRRQSLEQIARETGVSRWEVEETNAYVRGWVSGRQRTRGN
jgi:hypothetical protein